jgi:predicted aspartyl protease
MSSKILHKAFTQEYNKLSLRLITPVLLTAFSTKDTNPKKISINGLWDTGASDTVITKRVAQSLNLFPIDTTTVSGVNSIGEAEIAFADIELPNGFSLLRKRVIICEMPPPIDMLIGMDIILLGDFSICNANNKTLFSFAMPPFEDKIDYLDKAEQANKEN